MAEDWTKPLAELIVGGLERLIRDTTGSDPVKSKAATEILEELEAKGAIKGNRQPTKEHFVLGDQPMDILVKSLLSGDQAEAIAIATKEFPFLQVEKQQRKYTKQQMLAVFLRDGFIDRYSGERLYHPGFLRMLNVLLPDQFPFDAHGRLDKCHSIFWYLMPTVDHWVPIARGGPDVMENWITTSMKRNMAKGLWSLHDLGWNMHQSGKLKDWDGYSAEFVKLVEKYMEQASMQFQLEPPWHWSK